MKMHNYMWQMWDFPIAKISVWYGREEVMGIPDVAYAQCVDYEEEEY